MQVLDSVDERAIDALSARDEFFWLDLLDPPDEQLAALAERFGWHPLALEDTQHFGQRPKLDRYGDQMLIVFYGARPAGPATQLIEVHMLVSGSWVVTVRRDPCDQLDALRARLAGQDGNGEQFVVYRILDTIRNYPRMSVAAYPCRRQVRQPHARRARSGGHEPTGRAQLGHRALDGGGRVLDAAPRRSERRRVRERVVTRLDGAQLGEQDEPGRESARERRHPGGQLD